MLRPQECSKFHFGGMVDRLSTVQQCFVLIGVFEDQLHGVIDLPLGHDAVVESICHVQGPAELWS